MFSCVVNPQNSALQSCVVPAKTHRLSCTQLFSYVGSCPNDSAQSNGKLEQNQRLVQQCSMATHIMVAFWDVFASLGSSLTNETRQHELCHIRLVFWVRVVRPRSTRPVPTEICVDLTLKLKLSIYLSTLYWAVIWFETPSKNIS